MNTPLPTRVRLPGPSATRSFATLARLVLGGVWIARYADRTAALTDGASTAGVDATPSVKANSQENERTDAARVGAVS